MRKQKIISDNILPVKHNRLTPAMRRGEPEESPASAYEDYKALLLKYIPTDVVAAWVFLDGILRGDPGLNAHLHWAVFLIVLVLTPLWTWYSAVEQRHPLPIHRLVTSTMAFAVWVFALGGPFERLSWYTTTLASVLLALYTLAAPLIPFLLGHRPAGV